MGAEFTTKYERKRMPANVSGLGTRRGNNNNKKEHTHKHATRNCLVTFLESSPTYFISALPALSTATQL